VSRGAERHPLDALLQRHWRWLADVERDTVVLLRDDGLWVEIAAMALDSLAELSEAELEVIAATLDDARGRGRHALQCTTEDHLVVEADVAPWEPPVIPW
jgi:hypothetical protein